VEINGPYGHFVLDENHPAVMVAGGIGITPLKGMLEYIADRRLPTQALLLYSNRTEAEIAYRSELDSLVATHEGIRIEHTLTREAPSTWTGARGRVDAAMLERAMEDLDAPVFYVCGVPGMVEDVVRTLAGTGVDRARIRFEEFWGY
jgi:glycine betaine catabolism B